MTKLLTTGWCSGAVARKQEKSASIRNQWWALEIPISLPGNIDPHFKRLYVLARLWEWSAPCYGSVRMYVHDHVQLRHFRKEDACKCGLTKRFRTRNAYSNGVLLKKQQKGSITHQCRQLTAPRIGSTVRWYLCEVVSSVNPHKIRMNQNEG